MTPGLLSDRARSVRRACGPTSWVVLEELLTVVGALFVLFSTLLGLDRLTGHGRA